MLEKVRRSMQSGFTYVLVAGLTVIFMFFFGMPTQTCAGGASQRTAALAEVGGETLGSGDVNMVFNRVFDDSGSSDDDEYRRKRALALRNLVAIHWFADRAREEGFRVSDDQFKEFMRDSIRNLEYRAAYGREGSFNGHYYRAYVQNRLRTTLETYEQFKRDELLARKYLASRAAQSVVPAPELDDAFAFENTELNLEFVGIDVESLRNGIEVSEDDVETFLEEYRDRVEKEYEKTKEDKYSTPKELRVRRVYIVRPGKDASEEDKKKAKQKWNAAKKRIFEDGESVESVARDLGESGSDKGGLMSWSTAENMDSNIVGALEGADVGTKKKVETDYAYMVVKLEDRKEAAVTPLEEVELEIAENLLVEDRAEERISEVESKLLNAASRNDSLSAALESLRKETDDGIWKSLSADTTGSFSLETSAPTPGGMQGLNMNMGGSWADIPKIGSSEKLAATAYKDLTSESPVPDETFDVEDTTYVVRLKNRSEPGEDASPDIDMLSKLRGKKTQKLLGRWRRIFLRPMNDYGSWIEKTLKSAIDDGSIKFYTNNSRVANIANQSFEPGGMPSQGGPSGAAGGAKKKKALQKLKKKLKMQKKLKGGGGKKGIQLKPGKKGKKGGGKQIQLKPGKKGTKGGGKQIKLKPGGGGDSEKGGNSIELKPKGGSDSPSGEGSGESSSGNE